VIGLRGELKVLVASRPIDFRKGVHGLVALVAEWLHGNPYNGDVFVFRSKRKDRLKILTFDGTGMILATKWLEEGAFTFPPVQDGAVVLTATELSVLVAGLDWTRVAGKAVKRPDKVAWDESC
jgi:transposase